MKKIFIVVSLFLSCSAFAENVIYKCSTSTGEITYQNNAGDRSECSKTNLALLPSINFFKSDNIKNKSVNSIVTNNIPNKNSTNNNEEQNIRDSKRVLILTQELSQEKEQLNTVTSMLKNLKEINSKDSNQITQLEELKNSHTNNITAIERELGNKKSLVHDDLKIEKVNSPLVFNKDNMITTSAIKNNNVISLPISLPVIQPVVSSQNNKIQNHNINKLNPNNDTTSIKNNIVIEKNIMIEKRKNNSLGKNFHSSSGLSSMSKIKN